MAVDFYKKMSGTCCYVKHGLDCMHFVTVTVLSQISVKLNTVNMQYFLLPLYYYSMKNKSVNPVVHF